MDSSNPGPGGTGPVCVPAWHHSEQLRVSSGGRGPGVLPNLWVLASGAFVTVRPCPGQATGPWADLWARTMISAFTRNPSWRSTDSNKARPGVEA
jgi:hypothetical protein